jgi:hypothetical protein
MKRRITTLPASYEARIEAELTQRERSLSAPRALAQDVLKLSDHYTQNPDAPSPWTQTWTQAASLAYYFPLNYARARAVALEAERLGFFSGLDTLVDFGSGMGSAILAFRDVLEEKARPVPKLFAMDASGEALGLGRALAGDGLKPAPLSTPPRDHEKLLVLASYVATELSELPPWWFEAEALAIIEPSTQDDGRRLMRLRDELIARGHSVWAPCTHRENCPLLHRSEKDWCHDRIHFEAPGPWWEALEKELPMKNRTLTFSYLLARKTKPAPARLKGLTRLIGDRLEEKGKNRQAICRGDRREFLAWFPQRLKLKEGELEFDRGWLTRVSPDLVQKGAENSLEARIGSRADIELLDPDLKLED